MASSRGQGFLALILLIGIIVVGIGLTVAFLVYSSTDAIYGYQSSVRAEAVANSGAQDALLQLARNISFPASNYNVPVGSSTAAVAITRSGSIVTIVSSASVSNFTRKVQVVVAANATTSLTNIISWTDIQ